ncbi:mycofactocin system GMC family oxidoreductase MftG [Actinospica durhamensis]|uniref:Mycofactocin system GMC family oxidoreductase MftG n=1 Tax=Actinospica durhamensis TaxID=1508375 RepID=A0A941IQN6_9ACTN|nr:mycofactocin system GMC family oxidoreductase MftG [Actinospica durhamensis]MBR7833128.1 mycofactocin system GMC family oxidoreductase MftG [Actinospica durhamensis]
MERNGIGPTAGCGQPGFGVPDVVVVGAGAAGAVLAARLSEDADRRVLLLDAGPAPRSAHEFGTRLLDARLVPGAVSGQAQVALWPVRLTSQRPWMVPRGRVLGGSTTVNGGYFVRARREDFDRWAAAGNPAWAYDRVLPHLRALENDLDYGASPVHGGSGPVPVRRGGLDHPAATAFRSAASLLGYPEEPDKNDQAAPGFGPVPSNAVDGVRKNTALTYLGAEVRDRPNLRVLGESTVRRILFAAGRATGVLIEHDGRLLTLDAGTVVVSAGALGSAHLLLLSGIGPRADLERLGIPVVRDAPALGTRLSDHPQIALEWGNQDDWGEPRESWLGGCLHLRLPGGTGTPAGPGDAEILQSLVPMAGLVAGTTAVPGAALPFLVSVLTPRPTGVMRLRSADPLAPADIDLGYLGTAEDRRRMREAVRAAAALVETPPFTDRGPGLIEPGRAILEDDDALDAWIHGHLGTAQHTCGTVPMGPEGDPDAVVDQYGRVHGVRGLRVADTSILPDAPHRGPAATAVLIGELVADAIRRCLP